MSWPGCTPAQATISSVPKSQGPKLTSDNDTQRYFASNQPAETTSVDGHTRRLDSGDLVDKCYRLDKRLGQGGMGVVFSCRHEVLGNDYAIKLLHGDQLTEENWTRFQIEAKALAKLKHPGIVTIYNMGIDDGQYPYYVMDLLSGETLDQAIKANGPLTPSEAISYFVQVADALASAHQQQIIHRDIKPSNIMLLRDENQKIKSVKLVDFGIARISKASHTAQSQTATGLVFGTPYYMSPEQCQGSQVDERSDIYSFGCTLFEALTGAPPFRGENAFHTFMLHQNEPPPRLSLVVPEKDRQSIPESLDLALEKMLAKKADDRYQTMAQVRHDLERIGAGKSIMHSALSSTYAAQRSHTVSSSDHGDGKQTSGRASLSAMIALGLTALIAGGLTLGIVYKPRVKDPEIKTLKPFSEPIQDILDAQSKAHPEAIKAGEANSVMPGVSSLQNLFPEAITRNVGSDEEWLDMGATPAEIADLKQYDFLAVKENEKIFHAEFDDYIKKHSAGHFRFLSDTPRPVYRFPKHLIIGSIQFGNDKPIAATGDVTKRPGKRVTFYTGHATRENQDMLNFFAPNDINGLELQTCNVSPLIKLLSTWKKLDNLNFFNSLQKSLPKYRSFDESEIDDDDLPALEKFTQLRTLGLCNKVTGPAILKMQLLRHLDTLKLKETINILPLLKGLVRYANIKELWLVSCKTDDSQLKYLAAMPNLMTLRLRRSKLTPASAKEFQKFKALKHLYLDRPWSDEEKAAFKKLVPQVEFEPVLDRTYWDSLTADHPALKNP